MKAEEIQIRDPFVLPVHSEGLYYLFGTTDKNCWDNPGTGFDCYSSRDLLDWDGPIPAFRPQEGFWADRNFWTPEVHFYDGSYYMFATFKASHRYRGTQILKSDRPQGPYVPITNGPVTPVNWECLDGTLYIDESDNPWLIFCHEWQQVHDGEIHALRLSDDLRESVGRSTLLFCASEVPWVKGSEWSDENRHGFPNYVTDAPFIYKAQNNELLMLWSSWGHNGYSMGIARSSTGVITGPWVHDVELLWKDNGGHGMVFKRFDGQLMLAFHMPNDTPNERARFLPVREENGRLIII